jgi:hypothetical protein
MVLLACLVAACGKSEKKASEAAPKTAETKRDEKPAAPDPACAAKVKELEPWLAQLEIETASHEIDWGYKLPQIDRPAIPLSRHADWIAIGKELMAYDSTVHETTGADKPIAKNAKAIVEKLKQMHDTPASAEDKDAPSNDQLRLNVDEKAAWSDVVLVANAAAKAGYTELLFAFGATSKLTAPAGLPDLTTSQDDASKANHALEAMRETCKPWDRAVMRHTWNSDRAANATTEAHETAAALAECNCAVDPDEVKKLTWQTSRWHQAVRRTAIVVKLGGDGATAITQPGKTPWSQALARLVEAVPAGAPAPAITLAAK